MGTCKENTAVFSIGISDRFMGILVPRESVCYGKAKNIGMAPGCKTGVWLKTRGG